MASYCDALSLMAITLRWSTVWHQCKRIRYMLVAESLSTLYVLQDRINTIKKHPIKLKDSTQQVCGEYTVPVIQNPVNQFLTESSILSSLLYSTHSTLYTLNYIKKILIYTCAVWHNWLHSDCENVSQADNLNNNASSYTCKQVFAQLIRCWIVNLDSYFMFWNISWQNISHSYYGWHHWFVVVAVFDIKMKENQTHFHWCENQYAWLMCKTKRTRKQKYTLYLPDSFSTF